MVSEWFCQMMGSEVGPLSQRQLVDMVRHHQLNPEDLVRRNQSGWVPAFEVKGLFEAAAKPAAPDPKPVSTSKSDAKKSEMETGSNESRVGKPTDRGEQAKENLKPKSKIVDSKAMRPPEADAESKDDWFCIASGEKRGPLRFDELKSMANDGTLRGRDRVWRSSWPKFQKAAEVEGLDASS